MHFFCKYLFFLFYSVCVVLLTWDHLCTCGVFTVSLPFSPANKLMEHNPRRGSTLTRKQHASPAFQPPLPPVEAVSNAGGQPVAELLLQQPAPEGLGMEACQPSLALGMAALAAAQQLLAQQTEEIR